MVISPSLTTAVVVDLQRDCVEVYLIMVLYSGQRSRMVGKVESLSKSHTICISDCGDNSTWLR
jgi:hypothetical protein